MPARFYFGFYCYNLWPLPVRWSRAQRRLQGNNWLQLRRSARSEWAILPIQEVAAYPWCAVCEHLRSGDRPGPCRHTLLWTHGQYLPLSLLNRCSRDSFCKSSFARLRRCQLKTAERLALNPPLRRAKHQMSIHLSGNHFAARSMDPMLARSVSAQESATAVVLCRRQPNPGKWTPKSGAGVHGTCSLRPLSERPAWLNATSSSRPSQSFPIPARQRPLVDLGRELPNTSCRQRSQWSGAPHRDCCRRDGY